MIQVEQIKIFSLLDTFISFHAASSMIILMDASRLLAACQNNKGRSNSVVSNSEGRNKVRRVTASFILTCCSYPITHNDFKKFSLSLFCSFGLKWPTFKKDRINKFDYRVKTILLTALVRKILSLPLEKMIHEFALLCL